jgi:biotin-(acetyl-CoA carboxylase) ligase
MILRVLESLSEDRAAQMDIYRSLCPIAGREVAVLRGEERFFAKALSIENDGSLRLLKDGEEMLLSSGEISVRDV